MVELNEQLKEALAEIRKGKERKFDQTADLIVNLQKFDAKRSPVNIVVSVPNKIKDKKICAFLETENSDIDTITLVGFKKYQDKKAMKKLVDKYDFFISQASLMPKVATTFGKVLGPAGKMPSPQLGILMNADEKTIAELKTKINTSVKVKVKEASIKIPVGKQSMKDEEIIDNIINLYNAIEKALPRGLENIKNVEVKFTMSKPRRIAVR